MQVAPASRGNRVLVALCLTGELPTIEVVLPSTLAPAKSKSNQPYHGEDDRGDPQQMDGESSTEEDENKQQSEDE